MQYRKIQKHSEVKIVTSGYSDRYLSFDSIVTIDVIGAGDRTAKCEFPNSGDALDLLLAIGMEFDDAWQVACDMPITYTMGAHTANREWRNVVVNREELQSVKAFLQVRRSRGLTQEAIDRHIMWLNAHPLPEVLLAIVQGQLAECDRVNTERWGHPHGQEKE